MDGDIPSFQQRVFVFKHTQHFEIEIARGSHARANHLRTWYVIYLGFSPTSSHAKSQMLSDSWFWRRRARTQQIQTKTTRAHKNARTHTPNNTHLSAPERRLRRRSQYYCGRCPHHHRGKSSHRRDLSVDNNERQMSAGCREKRGRRA